MKRGKNYRAALAKYDPQQHYDVAKACEVVKDLHYVKFDETVHWYSPISLRAKRKCWYSAATNAQKKRWTQAQRLLVRNTLKR